MVKRCYLLVMLAFLLTTSTGCVLDVACNLHDCLLGRYQRNHYMACQCGSTYWSEWFNDPPNCCDPCSACGNYVGPTGCARGNCASCRRGCGLGILSGLRQRMSYNGRCGRCGGSGCSSCGGGGGCSSCGGGGCSSCGGGMGGGGVFGHGIIGGPAGCAGGGCTGAVGAENPYGNPDYYRGPTQYTSPTPTLAPGPTPEVLPPGPTSSSNMGPRRGRTPARPAVYDDVFEDNGPPPQMARRPLRPANY